MTDTTQSSIAYDPNNVFAKILAGELPCEKIYENEHVLAFMDIMPRAHGHALVIPKNSARNLLDIDQDDLKHVIAATQIIAQASKKAFDADGITIEQFNESAGGQVVFHLHFHVIPRHQGVPMRAHTGEMEEGEVLKANADKIRAALR